MAAFESQVLIIYPTTENRCLYKQTTIFCSIGKKYKQSQKPTACDYLRVALSNNNSCRFAEFVQKMQAQKTGFKCI